MRIKTKSKQSRKNQKKSEQVTEEVAVAALRMKMIEEKAKLELGQDDWETFVERLKLYFIAHTAGKTGSTFANRGKR